MNRQHFLSQFQRLFAVVGMVAFLSVLGLGIFSPSVHATSPAPVDCSASGSTCSPQEAACTGASGKWDANTKKCNDDSGNGPSVSATIKAVINLMLFAVGAIAVIVIVVSAVRFVNSGGDTQQVSKAKDAVIYALVGVVIAASAFAIVNFVLGQL